MASTSTLKVKGPGAYVDDSLLAGAATTVDGMPRKRFYRQRAHANPLSIHRMEVPDSPSTMDWSTHYPENFDKLVEFCDIGCGFGGLLISLASLYYDNNMLGIEIRTQVTQYVLDKISALRINPGQIDPDNPDDPAIITQGSLVEVEEERSSKRIKLDVDSDLLPPKGYSYQNVSVLRGNAMKFLPNFFAKAQMSKLFFLFPDPHFKARKHKARIISPTLLAEYAFVLKPGGLLYTITDVPDLHTWMISHLSPFPLFKRLTEEEIDNLGLDSGEGVTGAIGSKKNNEREKKVMQAVKYRTEEGRKVERNQSGKQWSVWRRIPDDETSIDDGIW